jgi:hypothetical protein
MSMWDPLITHCKSTWQAYRTLHCRFKSMGFELAVFKLIMQQLVFQANLQITLSACSSKGMRWWRCLLKLATVPSEARKCCSSSLQILTIKQSDYSCVKKHDSLHSPLNILVEHSHFKLPAGCMEDGKPSNPACPTFQDPWIQNLPPSDLFIQTCCTPAKEKGYWTRCKADMVPKC